MPSLEDVKKIELKMKICVYGFIRKTEQLFPTDNSYYMIPALVIHWIILYFASLDGFDALNVTESYQLSQANMVITRNVVKSFSTCAYLKAIAKQGVHRWGFKLRACNDSGYYMAIGIWKLTQPICIYESIELVGVQDGAYYAWLLNGKKTVPSAAIHVYDYGEDICMTGDVVEMILDLEKKTLSYKVNEKDYGIACQNIENTSYKAFVFMNFQADSLELLSYH